VRAAAFCVAFCFTTGIAACQNAAPVDQIRFDFEFAALQPPHWGFEIGSDGNGRYFEQGLPAAANSSGNTGQPIQVSASTMETLFAGRAALAGSKGCNSRIKNVAQTGKKKLSYGHDSVWNTCEFNYSDDAGVMRATAAFQAMAETLQFGERLKHEHRFDKLGLDAELDSLIEEAKDSRAMEIQNIAPVLQSLVTDDTLMERVRSKAQRLLDQSSGDAPAASPR
jgi:hypothetical protein